MSMITATSWVPRGRVSQFPSKYDFNDEEYDRIAQLARLHLDDAQDDLRNARSTLSRETLGEKLNTQQRAVDDDDLKEYNLENYDDTDEDSDEQGDRAGIFSNIKSLSYHAPGEQDPYVTLRQDGNADDEERQELEILPTDNLVLVAKVEDEVAHLEVCVYEDVEDNLYVHHDFMLPAIPLAVEYINHHMDSEKNGSDDHKSFVAVGTMEPDIELWDLDIVDSVYPNVILGQGASQAPKKHFHKKRATEPSADYHVDAVLSLAANRHKSNVLASASADRTVKLWDLNHAKCVKSDSYHTDKVCSLAWHPRDATAILSGSYDRTIVAADVRALEDGRRIWTVESDVEGIKWDPFEDNYFYVATEMGLLHLFDARMTPSHGQSQPSAVWRLQAHDKALSAFDVNPTIPGFLATGSADKHVKLWNIRSGDGPSMVISRDFGVGRVFSANFAPDPEVGFRLAIAGSKGALQIWDTSTNAAIRRAFATRMGPDIGEVSERLITIANESSESSEDDETEHIVDGAEAVDTDNDEGKDDDHMEGGDELGMVARSGGVRLR